MFRAQSPIGMMSWGTNFSDLSNVKLPKNGSETPVLSTSKIIPTGDSPAPIKLRGFLTAEVSTHEIGNTRIASGDGVPSLLI